MAGAEDGQGPGPGAGDRPQWLHPGRVRKPGRPGLNNIKKTEENTHKTGALPHGGERISVIGMGSSVIGGGDRREMIGTVQEAVAAGINYFDMAGGHAAIFDGYGQALEGLRARVPSGVLRRGLYLRRGDGPPIWRRSSGPWTGSCGCCERRGEPRLGEPLFFCISQNSALPTVRGWSSHIPDVADARQIHDHALKAQAKACVTAAAIAPQVAVPPVVLGLHAQLPDARLQHVQPLLALTAADDLADAGHQAVRRGHGFAVVVQAHIKRLDLLWDSR